MPGQHDFYQISLKVLLKNTKGEFLLLKAHRDGSYAGYYDLPGGRIDVAEFGTPLPAVVARELQEELGDLQYKLQEKPVAIGRHNLEAKFNKSGEDIHVLYLMFAATYTGGEICLSREHEGLRWVDLAKEDPAKYLKSGYLDGVRMYFAGQALR